jgi:hypothetical protein
VVGVGEVGILSDRYLLDDPGGVTVYRWRWATLRGDQARPHHHH